MCKMAHFGNCDPETADQEYCIFHKPNKSEDEARKFYRKFLERFKPRVEEIEVDGKKIKRLVFEGPVDARGFVFPEIPDEPIVYVDKNGNVWNQRFTFEFAIFDLGAMFSKAIFEGYVNFYRAHFNIRAIFDYANFKGIANFKKTLFTGEINFVEVVFEEEARFVGTKFLGHFPFRTDPITGPPPFDILFEGSSFYAGTSFKRAKFKGGAIYFRNVNFFSYLDFESSKFLSDVSFEHANFKSVVSFYKAKFKSDVIFSHAIFHDKVYFEDNKFRGLAAFDDVTFVKTVTFSESSFKNIEFERVTFKESSFFVRSEFKSISGIDTIFENRVKFQNSMFGDVMFEGVTFKDEVLFEESNFYGRVIFSNVSFRGYSSFVDVDFGPNIRLKNFAVIIQDVIDAIEPIDVIFEKVTFEKTVRFYDNSFVGRHIRFVATIFNEDASFFGILLLGLMTFQNIKVYGTMSFDRAMFLGKLTFKYAIFQETLILCNTTFGIIPSWSWTFWIRNPWILSRISSWIQDDMFPIFTDMISSYCELNFKNCTFKNMLDFGFNDNLEEFKSRFPRSNPQPLKEATKFQRITYEHLGEREKADMMFILEMRAKRTLRLLNAKEHIANSRGFGKLKWYLGYLGAWIGVQVEKVLADWVTEYGTNWRRVLTSSGIIIGLMGIIYWILSKFSEKVTLGIPIGTIYTCKHCASDGFSGLFNALYYSLVTFTTLGYGDMHPTGWLKALSAIEALTGAVFMALIVAVIARKWMR